MLRMYHLSVCFLILYIQPSARGSPLTGRNARIADKNEFPFVVSLSWKNPVRSEFPEHNHFCGGAIISKTHVLTAAHCFSQVKSRGDLVVKVNDRDLLKSKIYKVKKWTTYDEWANINVNSIIPNETFNDVAIIELNRKVSSNIEPAVLTNTPEVELYGDKVVTAGWGIISNNPRFPIRPRFLQTAELYILQPHECLRNLEDDVKSEINNPTHRFMCTIANPPVYTECGDSGSPLFIEPRELVGVVKGFCIGSADNMVLVKQNLHVSINYYREFITDIITCKGTGCCIPQ